MMKYNCNICKYSTNERGNWYRHKKSKRHINNENITNIYIDNEQNMCHNDTKNNINKIEISDENKSLTDLLIKEKDKQINRLLKDKTDQSEKANAQIDYLKSIIEHMKSNTTSSSDIAKTSVSSLNYLLTNCKQAPPLKQIEREEAQKILSLQYNNLKSVKDHDNLINSDSETSISIKKKKLTIDEKEEMFVKKILLLHSNKKLANYIKDIITPIYKKEDPRNQSMWNTDVSRLNYLIKDIVGKQENWISDKKGIKLTKYIINPITSLILEMIEKYIDQQFIITQDITQKITTIEKAGKLHRLAVDLKDSLLSGDINDDICDELCPEFHLDKTYVASCIESTDNIKSKNTKIKKLSKTNKNK